MALARDPRVDEHDLSSLATVATGGAAVPPGSLREASDRLDALVSEGYGITEATCMVSGPLGRPSTPGTAGWLVRGTEVRVVDPETGEDLPDGEPGELLVRSPQIMEGYHGLPEETAATLDDGRLDAHGRPGGDPARRPARDPRPPEGAHQGGRRVRRAR